MVNIQRSTQVFISHATENYQIAHQLANDLKKEGFGVWIAPDSILPGEQWVDAIDRGLETSEIMLVLLSHQAVESRWVKAEMEIAIDRERAGNIRIIPLQIEVCKTPPIWRRYQFIPFQIYQVGWRTLITSLRSSSPILLLTPFPIEVSLITKFYAAGGIGSLAFTPIGNLVAGGRSGSIYEWKLPSGQESIPVSAHEKPITNIAISPNGDLLATASQDNLVKLWSLPNFNLVATLVGHTGTVNALSFSFDGTKLVSGSRDTTVCVWSIPDGKCIHILKKHTKSVYGVSFSPRENLIASASSDNSIILWSEVDGYEGNRLGKPGSTTLINTVFSPDGKLLAAGTWGGVIRFWDIEKRKGAGILEGHSDRVYGLAFAPSGSMLASGSKDGYLRLWKIPEKDLAYPPIKEHAGWIRALAFSPNGSFLATGDSDGIIVLWSIKTI